MSGRLFVVSSSSLHRFFICSSSSLSVIVSFSAATHLAAEAVRTGRCPRAGEAAGTAARADQRGRGTRAPPRCAGLAEKRPAICCESINNRQNGRRITGLMAAIYDSFVSPRHSEK